MIYPTYAIAAFATFLFVSLGSAEMLEMADLIAHPEIYDHQAVVVIGTVADVQVGQDQQGSFFKFLLEDPSGTVQVTATTPVQNGDEVIIEGVFSRRRQSGRMPVHSKIKANSVRPINGFNPELIG